jgi:hypothetical protein
LNTIKKDILPRNCEEADSMPSKTLTIILSLAFLLIGCAESAKAQWIPKRVVGMEYSELAATARMQGQVEILCTINSDGSVASTKVIKTPWPLLADYAQENAKKWLFYKGSASTEQNTFLLKNAFQLEGEGTDHPQNRFVFEYPNHVIVSSDNRNIRTAGH